MAERRTVRRVAGGGIVLGLALIVTGTFLPWLHAGRATHNSYETDGAIQRLLPVPGWAHPALSAWPFVGLVAAAGIALLALGWFWPGAGLAVLLAVLTGAAAVGVLEQSGNLVARPAGLGPQFTLAGGTVSILAVMLAIVGRYRADPREGQHHELRP